MLLNTILTQSKQRQWMKVYAQLYKKKLCVFPTTEDKEKWL